MSPCIRDAVLETLQGHTKLLSELLPERIEELQGSVDALRFLREFVGPSKPVVVRGDVAVARWPALSRWKDQAYLNHALRDVDVTVALTPDGLADAVSADGAFFMLPAEAKLPYRTFVDMLRRQRPVVYLQKQNDSFASEFGPISGDVGRLPWADAAFGGASNLDAVNFWQGRAPTKTSWHRDPYENVYVVLRGSKRCRLLPMTDGYRLQIKPYRQAEWRYENDTFSVHPCEAAGREPVVPWSSMQPCSCVRDSYGIQRSRRCASCTTLADHPPKEVTLNAGDVLYIPAFTYHELVHDPVDDAGADESASSSTIAVNFWYETQYGHHGFATATTFDRLSAL